MKRHDEVVVASHVRTGPARANCTRAPPGLFRRGRLRTFRLRTAADDRDDGSHGEPQQSSASDLISLHHRPGVVPAERRCKRTDVSGIQLRHQSGAGAARKKNNKPACGLNRPRHFSGVVRTTSRCTSRWPHRLVRRCFADRTGGSESACSLPPLTRPQVARRQPHRKPDKNGFL